MFHMSLLFTCGRVRKPKPIQSTIVTIVTFLYSTGKGCHVTFYLQREFEVKYQANLYHGNRLKINYNVRGRLLEGSILHTAKSNVHKRP